MCVCVWSFRRNKRELIRNFGPDLLFVVRFSEWTWRAACVCIHPKPTSILTKWPAAQTLPLIIFKCARSVRWMGTRGCGTKSVASNNNQWTRAQWVPIRNIRNSSFFMLIVRCSGARSCVCVWTVNVYRSSQAISLTRKNNQTSRIQCSVCVAFGTHATTVK